MVELSVIIPAYNEEKRIEKSLSLYLPIITKRFKSYEMIVVCNGCTDNTPEIVKKISKNNPNVTLLEFKEKIGKGGAIIEGIKVARGEIIGFLDADASTLPESVISLVESIGEHDGIIGSRWVRGALIYQKQPYIRRVLSRVFNILVKLLFDLKYEDTQCGAKFFKKEAIKKVASEVCLTDWSFDVELLYRMKLHGFTVKEHPIKWAENGHSKLHLMKTPIKMFFSVVGLRMKFDKRFERLTKSRLASWLYWRLKRL